MSYRSKQTDRVHNGPLTPNQRYAIQQRNYAEDKTGESLGWIFIKTRARPEEPRNLIPLIAGVAVGVIILIIVIVVPVYRKRRQHSEGDIAMVHIQSRPPSGIGKSFLLFYVAL